jgi:2-desacetyl-2-hydroxyethyl bacteriochlorophyllide A dehydrogenase
MRAATLRGPGDLVIQDVPVPVPGPDDALIEVERVGLCGTDVEFFTGEMPYLHSGHAAFPLRLGHEWSGRVIEAGNNVSADWIGHRVTGDTMVGEGSCRLCQTGRQHLCEKRTETGLFGLPGALAEYVCVPARSLHRLPDAVDPALGALVEPGGNALRAARAAEVRVGEPLLVVGPGTIGLLVALFARAAGAEVHLLGLPGPHLEFATTLGFTRVWTRETLPAVPFDAIVDASTSADVPALAVDLVAPGGRVALIGLAGAPSQVDTRHLALKDVTAVGVLSASPALADTIELYASGAVDPRPLVGAVVGLDKVSGVLSGQGLPGRGAGPKVHVNPWQ